MAAAEIKTLAARRFFIRKLPFAQEHVLLTPMLSNPKNSVTLGESAHYLGSGNHRRECWDVRRCGRSDPCFSASDLRCSPRLRGAFQVSRSRAMSPITAISYPSLPLPGYPSPSQFGVGFEVHP